jgi:RNA polymerase sigma factor (sigma-70 family)
LSDIVQETFTKAFAPSARERYDGTRCYAPYLLAIARNCFVDWLRRAGRELPADQDLDALSNLAGDCETEPEFAPELLAAANRYVSGLTGELRAVHRQRFELGKSQVRAAEGLRISRQNLRTLEHKLIAALRWEITTAGWPVPARQRGQPSSHASAPWPPQAASVERRPMLAQCGGARGRRYAQATGTPSKAAIASGATLP